MCIICVTNSSKNSMFMISMLDFVITFNKANIYLKTLVNLKRKINFIKHLECICCLGNLFLVLILIATVEFIFYK